jgi:hypothetical protein
VVRQGGGLDLFIPDIGAIGSHPKSVRQRSDATGRQWRDVGEITSASEAERSVIDFLGVQALTPARFEAAKLDAATHVDDYPFNAPALIKMVSLRQTVGDANPKVYADVMARVESSPFQFWVDSPYTRVIVAWRAESGAATASYPSIAALNADGVRLAVQDRAAQNPDAVQSAIIRRGADSIRPVKTSKEGITTLFTFDYAAFAPSAPITIVLAGRSSRFEWVMTPRELKMLK